MLPVSIFNTSITEHLNQFCAANILFLHSWFKGYFLYSMVDRILKLLHENIFMCSKSISYLRNFGNAADGIRLFEVFAVFIVLFLYLVACSFFLDKVLSKLLSSFASSKVASVFALLKVLLLKVWNRYWQ